MTPEQHAAYGQATANLRRIRHYRDRAWKRDRLELALLAFSCIVLGALADHGLDTFCVYADRLLRAVGL
ncbi:MAG: hypothetical protein H0X39_00160 [Actinobacteria bacterium]|nr:hypothetical protein [Actinomycetota bacterium]